MTRRKDIQRIAAPHQNGLSERDLSVISESVRLMRRHGVGVHVSVNIYDLPEDQRHKIFDRVKGRAATYQARSGMTRVIWLSVKETLTEQGYSLHLHLICVFPTPEAARQFVDSLNGSHAFRRLGEKAVHAVVVNGEQHWEKLSGSYFTQEATMQAWHSAGRSFPKPQNPLTGRASFPYAGDRVGASDALKDMLARNGHAKPWVRLNAKRVPPPCAASDSSVAAVTTPKPVLTVVSDNALAPGELQLSLLPEKPVTRLRDFAHGVMSRAVAHEIEVRRKWLSLTQEQLADAIGISRPQLTNALQGKFGLSEWGAARLRDFLLRGERLAA